MTSHVVCGPVPTTVAGPFTVTDDLLEAVTGLRAGHTIVLPEGRFDLAEAVLHSVGASPEHISFSIAYAQGLLPGMQPEQGTDPITVDDKAVS